MKEENKIFNKGQFVVHENPEYKTLGMVISEPHNDEYFQKYYNIFWFYWANKPLSYHGLNLMYAYALKAI